ncbi:MAG: glycyl-radical enzyme activating protein [Clostridiaceae bacterium]|jgi:pyruvate formate lyase activating enzyme|nr:glycyl-radical enzyme activating protein [Clostridiaceae bacterium]
MEALILDIQRMSTEDGPGLRTTVFFKGCNLACGWCHNPESISFKPDLNWYMNKCINCDSCKDICPNGVLIKDESGVHFKDRSKCLTCGKCVDECPGAGIELKGKKISVEKLKNELLKDRAYFGHDGGVTLSGGEVMMQPQAATELAKLLKADGVSVAIDTAGCYAWSLLESILPYADIFLYDLKIFDADAHKKHTRVDNAHILDNYKRLIATGARVWVRTPLIAGATDGEDNIKAIAEFLRDNGLPERWELCTFNNLCKDKYTRLDLDWEYKAHEKTKKSYAEKLKETAQKYVPCAVYSGVTTE